MRRCRASSGAGCEGVAGRRCTVWPGAAGCGGVAWRRCTIRCSATSRSSRQRVAREGSRAGVSFCPISRASSTSGSGPGWRAAAAAVRLPPGTGGVVFVLTRRYRSSAMPILHRFRGASVMRVRIDRSSTMGVRVRPRRSAQAYHIADGAPTPSSPSPTERTVAMPSTNARRAKVISLSSCIIKRKYGESLLPRVHWAWNALAKSYR